jgi:hypothetical protein
MWLAGTWSRVTVAVRSLAQDARVDVERFLRRRVRHRRVVAATAGLGLVAVLGAAVVVARQLPQDREPAAPAANAAEPTPRPHQWVYTKDVRVEYGSRKPWTQEHWIRVDGRKFINASSERRAGGAPKVRRERMQLPPSRCPPGKPERIRPAVGLGRFFPNPAAVPTDPDGLLAAVYQLVEGATDATGRRGVAFARAAAIEGPGSSDWLRLEIILDPNTYRYLGARHVVTRDHLIPDTPSGSKGTSFRTGQVLVSRAQLALAVLNAPCEPPGETTTCASYVETTLVAGVSSQTRP